MKFLILMTLIFGGTALSASSPEQVARSYANATIKQDWHAAASYFRGADLQRIRSAFSSQLDRPGGDGIRKAFFDDLSRAEIDKLTDLVFCEKIFYGYFSTMAAKGTELQIKEYSILGSVPDGPNTTYVVMKQQARVAGMDVEGVEAMGTVRDADQWYMAIPKQLETVIAMWTKANRQSEARP